MDDVLKFKVKGSSGQTYTTTFWRKENDLKTACTCSAGRKGMYCKHRFQILEGDITNLVSDNIDDLEKLSLLLIGSDVEEILVEFLTLKNYETIYKKYKKMIFKTKLFEHVITEVHYTLEELANKKITLVKIGRECFYFDFNFDYLGYFSADLKKLKKIYPNINLEQIKSNVYIYTENKEKIDVASKFDDFKDRLKKLTNEMKIAMR